MAKNTDRAPKPMLMVTECRGFQRGFARGQGPIPLQKEINISVISRQLRALARERLPIATVINTSEVSSRTNNKVKAF